METKNLVNEIVEIIQSKKGYDITILNLTNLSAVADYFIICSGDVDVHVKAIADEIDKKLRKDGIKCYNKEGYTALNWVLIDYFDVVVHVFKKDARIFYNLEKLWGDAEITEIENSN
ncbi:MAG: ribosome silencing factor [Ignavibacteriae bacterium]|nr:ribosome silencing factor [Ignavibacteriota bacterium]